MNKIPTILAPGLVLAVLLTACAEKQPQEPALAASCVECHRHEGGATVPGWPPLASLSSADIEAKLRGYRAGNNPDSRMTEVAHDFSDEDIRLLAAYYGSE